MEEKRRLDAAIERIEAAVDQLPSVERRLIIMRYSEGLSWRKIAVELGFSEDHVSGFLHKKALRYLATID